MRFPLWCSLVALTAGGSASAADKPPSLTLNKVGEYHLLTGRQGAAAAAQGGFIYIFGGYELGLLTDVERFDPRTNRSERIYDKLIPRHYHRAVEFKGKIYLFGGQGNAPPQQPYESAVEIYDPAANRVARGADLPEARAHMATARVGDKIVLCGGVKAKDGQRMQTNETLIYDPALNRWSNGMPMPTPREGHAVTAGRMVIVPAGYSGRAALAVVESFVPQDNTWKSLPPLSRAVSAHSLALLDPYLFFFGDYATLDLVLAYDLRTRQTLTVTAKFEGLRHTAAVVLDRKIYVLGGNNDASTTPSDLVQVFALP